MDEFHHVRNYKMRCTEYNCKMDLFDFDKYAEFV